MILNQLRHRASYTQTIRLTRRTRRQLIKRKAFQRMVWRRVRQVRWVNPEAFSTPHTFLKHGHRVARELPGSFIWRPGVKIFRGMYSRLGVGLVTALVWDKQLSDLVRPTDPESE